MTICSIESDHTVKLVAAYLKVSNSKLSEHIAAFKVNNLSLLDNDLEHENTNPNGVFGVNNILIQIALDTDKNLLGETDQEKAEISQWISLSSKSGTVNRQVFTQSVNDSLEGNEFLVSNKITLADLVSFANINGYMKTLSDQKKRNLGKFTLWLERTQSTIGEQSIIAAGLEVIETKGKINESSKENLTGGVGKDKKSKKKVKGEKSGDGAKQPPKVKEEIKIVPSMIDLRVGLILNAERHPDADSLYVEQIEVGEEKPRTVISGLVKYIPIEKMQNRLIVTICNLKPATMRGIKSHAMVLCADSIDGSKVEFIEPPAGSKPGDRVYFEGFENMEPEVLLNPKKKIWETIQPGFITSEEFEAGWINPETKKFHKLLVNGQICKAQTIAGGPMK
ncbi:hypothetical protein BB559_000631 [Furculomyces boomerangus]|uniref:tRNA-binding domain-containing protein n=2 Tax=Harpellales TaxID=61421 RepID=A0A2T9Z4K3_9FUNG|nr:hypothetical protein BB559_000631 [Furculomyces boomerangus]PVZ97001.1 hypothetical protein BB558_007059 [Smittium angustum]